MKRPLKVLNYACLDKNWDPSVKSLRSALMEKNIILSKMLPPEAGEKLGSYDIGSDKTRAEYSTNSNHTVASGLL